MRDKREATAQDFRNELSGLGSTIDALAIILTSPVWPKEADLPEAGVPLYHSLAENAKPYAKALSASEYGLAFKILGEWGQLVNQFIDSSYIADNEASQKLLAVFKHYADAMADFSKIS